MDIDVPRPFEGALVRLRAPEREDLPRLNELFNDTDVRGGLTMVWPQPLEGIEAFMERSRRAEDVLVTVIEVLRSGEAIGLCALEAIDSRTRAAELGIWIGRPHWDRGYGTDATRTICRYGVRSLNLHRIQLHVIRDNTRAVRAYEKAGFRPEGTLREAMFLGGRRVDLLVMGLLSRELG